MLRSVDGWEGEHFSFGAASAAATAAPTVGPTQIAIDNGSDGPSATIPDSHLLFTAQFSRAGADLVLTGEAGKAFVVHDYFATDVHARLLSPEGAALSPDVVAALAGPQAPGQYAQAGAAQPAAQAVGRVVQADSDATIVRNGVAMAAHAGDAILKSDVLQTVAGTFGVTFNDGSTLNLTANSRLVVNEFVYDPKGSANSQLLDLVQGSLTFISGEVAHNGDMKIGTPVATMAIRGTVGGVTTAIDGTVNFYVSQSATGAVILDSRGNIIANVVQDGPMILVRPVGPLQVLAEEIQKTPVQLATELAALQQILSIKAIGDQILQQNQQQDPNANPNPQSTDKPHTQFQIDLHFNNPNGPNGTPGPDDGNPAPPISATVTPTPPDGDGNKTPPVDIKITADLPPLTFGPQLQAVNEDTALVFSSTHGNAISVFDADTALLTVTIGALHGVVSLSGVAGLTFTSGDGSGDATMTFSGTQAAINAALEGMSFTPAADYSGSASVSVSTSDGHSTSATDTIAITVAAVKDAPVIAQPNSPTMAYVENQPATSIDAVLTLSDVDSATLSGATVTISANFHFGQDVLSFTDQNGIVGSYDSETGVLTLSGTASVADYQAALRSVAYANTSDNPSADARTISYQVDDGSADNHLSNIATANVTVTPVNDVPVLDYFNLTVTEGGATVLSTGDFHITDPDSCSFFFSVAGVSGGQFQVFNGETWVSAPTGGFTVSDIAAGHVRFVHDGGNAAPTFTVWTSDNTEQGAGAAISPTIVFENVNEAPVLTLSESNYVADQFVSQAYNLNTGTVNWSTDWIETNDGTSNQATTGEIKVAVDSVTSADNFRLFLSDSDSESGAADTIQRTANLAGALSATLEFDYRRDIPSGQSDDQFPVLISTDGINFIQIGQIGATGDGSFVDGAFQHFSFDISSYISAQTTIQFSVGDSVDNGDVVYVDNVNISYTRPTTFVENGAAVAIISGDAGITDSDNTHLQSATITLTNHQADDLLSVNGTLPAGIVKSSYNASSGVLTLTGNAALADYQTALRQIEFSNTGDNPGSADRIITVTVSDGAVDSNAATTTIHVTPVNDAPTPQDDSNPGTFVEDTDTVIAASVLLANDTDPDGDALTIVSVGNSAHSGVVTLNGTDITYRPAANYSGFDWFVYTVSDGQTTVQRAATFTVSAVNDAPSIDLNGANAGGDYSTTVLSYSTSPLAHDDAVAVLGANVVVSDVDNTTVQSASIALSFNDGREDYTTYSTDDVFVDTGLLTGFSGTEHGGEWHGLQWQYMGDPNGIRFDISGDGSLADYQQLLEAARFSTTSTDYADRIATLTVNDGSDDSAAVTSTIHVQNANDTVAMTATAWSGAGTIDLGSGTDTVNVSADANISALGTPTVVNVETGNLVGTGGNDTVTLTGLQLDAIIIGNGAIDLGGGSNDTINLTSTSADLNTLGATDVSIAGVEFISASTAAASVTIDLHGQSEGFTLTGSTNADTLTGGSGVDTVNGGNGNDIITGGANADNLIGGLGADSFIIASASDLAGDTIDGTAESATIDAIKLTVGGSYDMSAATISNIDNVVLSDAAGGYVVTVGDAMVSTANYNGSSAWLHFGTGGATIAGDVTVDASGLTGGNGIFFNGGSFAGNDTLKGGAGNDLISGGAGDDTIIGGGGDDHLNGNTGNDMLAGGSGADEFAFNANFGNDTVSDFVHGTDTLQFDDTVFASAQAVIDAMSAVEVGTVITHGADTVTLFGISVETLTTSDIHINHVIV
jgi:hypothetical protein